jgi:hypothetical protein
LALNPLSDFMHDGTEQLRTEIVMGVSTSATLQDAVSATGNGTDFTVDGYGITTLQITGTFVATITFYGSADGTNFVNISATNRNTGARVLNTTSAGLYDIDCRGLQKIRASVTWTSGTSVTVFGVAEPFSGSNSTLEISNSNVEQTPGSAIPAKAAASSISKERSKSRFRPAWTTDPSYRLPVKAKRAPAAAGTGICRF